MKIYRAVASYDDEIRVNVPSRVVFESEPQVHFSGLLDAHGNKLMVVKLMNPIGFVVFGDVAE